MKYNEQTQDWEYSKPPIRFSACWSDKLGEAIKLASTEPYNMELVGEDRKAVTEAINQGIDAHLEAIMFSQPHTDTLAHKLNLVIEPQTLHVLIRRLMESGNEEAESLASSICQTIGIELI